MGDIREEIELSLICIPLGLLLKHLEIKEMFLSFLILHLITENSEETDQHYNIKQKSPVCKIPRTTYLNLQSLLVITPHLVSVGTSDPEDICARRNIRKCCRSYVALDPIFIETFKDIGIFAIGIVYIFQSRKAYVEEILIMFQSDRLPSFDQLHIIKSHCKIIQNDSRCIIPKPHFFRQEMIQARYSSEEHLTG